MGPRLEHPPSQKFRLRLQRDVGLIGGFVAVIVDVGFHPKDQIRIIGEGIQQAPRSRQDRTCSRRSVLASIAAA